MKKALLTTSTLGIFALYSLIYRFTNTSANNTQPTLTSSNLNFPIPTANPSISSSPSTSYKDGTYTGSAANAFYGNVQVSVTIAQGKLTNIQVLQSPNDRGRSIMINNYAMPILRQEAIQAQSANVDIVSGATDSSMAFQQSLSSALSQAL